MKLFLITLMLAVPSHPADTSHRRHIVRLCDKAEVTIPVPAKGRMFTVDEWVNGKELMAWKMSNTIWFFGEGVSGRIVQHPRNARLQVVRHAAGCVRFVVAWWPN